MIPVLVGRSRSLVVCRCKTLTRMVVTSAYALTWRSVNRRVGSVTSIPRRRLIAVGDSQSGSRKTPLEMFLYSSGYLGPEKGKHLSPGTWRHRAKEDGFGRERGCRRGRVCDVCKHPMQGSGMRIEGGNQTQERYEIKVVEKLPPRTTGERCLVWTTLLIALQVPDIWSAVERLLGATPSVVANASKLDGNL